MSKIIRNIPDGLEASYENFPDAVRYVDTIADLANVDTDFRDAGGRVIVKQYHSYSNGEGGGIFYFGNGKHNGCTFIDPSLTVPTYFTEAHMSEVRSYLTISDTETGCWVKILNKDFIDPAECGAVRNNNSYNNTYMINHALKISFDHGLYEVKTKGGYYRFGDDFDAAGNAITGIVVPPHCYLTGKGAGLGSNRNTELRYIGSDKALTINSYYQESGNFALRNFSDTMGEKIGIYLPKAQAKLTKITILAGEGASHTGFKYGTKNMGTSTTFTHTFKQVHIHGCYYGVHAEHINNLTLDNCFIESCNINVHAKNGTNINIVNGTVLELFGDGRAQETDSSICANIEDFMGINFIGVYSEAASLATAHSNQKLYVLTNVKGGSVTNGYCATNKYMNDGDAPIVLNGTTEDVIIANNRFHYLGQLSDRTLYAVKADSVETMMRNVVSNNSTDTYAMDIDNLWTPEIRFGSNPSDATYTVQHGRWVRTGNEIKLYGTVVFTKGSNTGTAAIYGVPIKVQDRTIDNLYIVGSVRISGALGTHNNTIQIRKGREYLSLFKDSSLYTDADFTYSDCQINFEISFPVK